LLARGVTLTDELTVWTIDRFDGKPAVST